MDFTMIEYFTRASTLMLGVKNLQLDKSLHQFSSFITNRGNLIGLWKHDRRHQYGKALWSSWDEMLDVQLEIFLLLVEILYRKSYNWFKSSLDGR